VFRIHKSRTISDVRSKCSEWLKTDDYILVCEKEELLSEDTLEMADIVEDATIRVTLDKDIPKKAKPGYFTRPDYADLIISKDLRNIENFSIENEHGKIEWLGFVDLTGVDFEDCVTINAHFVELYEGSQKAEKG